MNFKVSQSNLKNFEAKMTKLSNKAHKLGLEFGYEIQGYEMKSLELKDETGYKFSVQYKEFSVDVWGMEFKISDWNFLATIQPVSDGVNLVRSYVGEVDHSYRTIEPRCEHCNTVRNRKDTFVIQNVVNGETKQVGRNCLADFIGHPSAETVAKFYESLSEIKETVFSDEPCDEVLDRSPYYYNLVEFIAYVLEDVENYGYVSASRSRDEGIISTKNSASNSMFKGEQIDSKYFENAKSLLGIAIGNLEPRRDNLNDYEYNLYTILTSDAIEYRMFGYAASIVPFVHKIQETEQKETSKVASQWIGETGQKITGIKVILVADIETPGYYGTTHIVKMLAGNDLLVWFSSNNGARFYNIGDEITISKATIKELGDFRGEKQTIIKSVKFVEDEENLKIEKEMYGL